MQSHKSCRCRKFLIFPNVSFHVSSQIACLNRCKVTTVADMRNFSIKWFSNVFWNCLFEQMQSHISCMCLIFSNVSFHVSSKIAYLNKCKVTIVENFSNISQNLPPAKSYSKSSYFQNLNFFDDFYAFTVCHEVVHVSSCRSVPWAFQLRHFHLS